MSNPAEFFRQLADGEHTDEVARLHAERVPPEVLALVARHRQSLSLSLKWRTVEWQDDGEMLEHAGRRWRVIWSIALQQDGRPWLHLSMSLPGRPPMHDELAVVKDLFIGDRYAYAVWPPADRYVNLSPNVLHLWAPWDDGPLPLPEFSAVLGDTRTI